MAQAGQLSFEKFTQRDQHGTILTVSLEVVLYATKPQLELADWAISCYSLFLEKYRDTMNWYLASSMRKARRFSSKSVDIFPTICRKPDSRYPLPFYRVFNGSGRCFRPRPFLSLPRLHLVGKRRGA